MKLVIKVAHVWLHHKNQNASFCNNTTNGFHKGVSIYKAFVIYLLQQTKVEYSASGLPSSVSNFLKR